MGSACWELFCIEHGLLPDGTLDPRDTDWNSPYAPLQTKNFFARCSDGTMRARSIFIDLEPSAIDEIRNGSYRKLF